MLFLKDDTDKGSQCKSIGNTELRVGERVHYIGYPNATTGRPIGTDSNGDQLSMGQGHIIESILENPCVIGSEKLKTKYDRDELLLSTVDIVPGASGSSLLDKDGNIVGLLNSSFSQGVNIFSQYCEGSAVAIKIGSILNFLEEKQFSKV